jgi:hypothetical protein
MGVREMPLGSGNDDNVAQLMGWLRSEDASSDAVRLREELAYLLFYGDATWANNDDSSSVSDYRAILAGWFESDTSNESKFIELTAPGNWPEEFITWFTPVVEKWKEWAKTTEGDVEKGIPNPNYAADRTPGTQYYWYDAANEVYLYASKPDAPDDKWLSYEDRRYTPIAYDDARETNYRQDIVTGAYEFQSRKTPARWLTAVDWNQEVPAASAGADESHGAGEPLYTVPVYDAGFQMYRRFNSVSGEYEFADDVASQTWLSPSQATARLTGGSASSASPATAAEAEWDENWEMFFRIGADRVYEYAHANTPFAESSGCSNDWMAFEAATKSYYAKKAETGAAANGKPAVEAVAQEVRQAITEPVLIQLQGLAEQFGISPDLAEQIVQEEAARLVA